MGFSRYTLPEAFGYDSSDPDDFRTTADSCVLALTHMSLTITMGQGNTPLIQSSRSPALFFKLENCNPSGSYKDRFVAAEVADILARGSRSCVATSSGNTGSSLAAYCARYGLRCLILVNQDVLLDGWSSIVLGEFVVEIGCLTALGQHFKNYNRIDCFSILVPMRSAVDQRVGVTACPKPCLDLQVRAVGPAL